ncbi:MAG: AMP-binding protein [Butyrivibrio sp.]
MITYSSEQKEYFEQLLAPEDLAQLPLCYTFCELLENCKKKFADCPAISDMVDTINYGELYDRIAHRRAFLYEQGFEKGDIIAVLAPNGMAAMELYMAIPTAGFTVIMLPAAENAISHDCLTKLIHKFDIKGLFIHPSFEKIAANQPVKVFSVRDTSENVGDMAQVDPEDIAVICFSVNNDPANPYGAMLSHRAIMRAAHNGLFIPGHPFNQRTIAILPLSHVFGAIRGLLTCIYTGALVYACEDMSNIVFDIPKMKPTILTLVPGLAETVLAVARIKGREFLDGIETIICGGAYVQPKLIKQAESLGITLFGGYGMTEASNIVSGNVDSAKVPDSIGKVYPGTEVRIVDGEIQVRGDVVMKGYYNDPERTAEVFTADGWLRTGDLGEFDEENYLHITGLRKNLIILPNGENISPEELENVLRGIEGIEDCAVREGDLRGRPLIEAVVLPDMDFYKDTAASAIEEDLKAKVKSKSAELPSYKGISKTTVTYEQPDHTVRDRFFKIEW